MDLMWKWICELWGATRTFYQWIEAIVVGRNEKNIFILFEWKYFDKKIPLGVRKSTGMKKKMDSTSDAIALTVIRWVATREWFIQKSVVGLWASTWLPHLFYFWFGMLSIIFVLVIVHPRSSHFTARRAKMTTLKRRSKKSCEKVRATFSSFPDVELCNIFYQFRGWRSKIDSCKLDVHFPKG